MEVNDNIENFDDMEDDRYDTENDKDDEVCTIFIMKSIRNNVIMVFFCISIVKTIYILMISLLFMIL